MSDKQQNRLTRRALLGGAIAAGTAGLLGLRPERAAAEPPPETTKLRIPATDALCVAPQYFAEELLRVEGFTEVQYVKTAPADLATSLTRTTDMTMHTPAALINAIDTGVPIVILGGVHVGCFELFGTNRIRSIGELKGKTVAAGPIGIGRQLFLTSMLAYVGLDPRKDVIWSTVRPAAAMQLLADGTIDAFMGFSPEPQELRAKKIGRVMVNTMLDRPWSQYFCCNVAASREFVRKHPVATKRYDYTLQGMNEIPYNKWRDYDSEDSVRFFSLVLQEGGLIKSSPQKIIAQGTDWRFLTELKKELKA